MKKQQEGLSKNISGYITRGDPLKYWYVLLVSNFWSQRSNTNALEVNELITKLRTANIIQCWFRHHNIRWVPWTKNESGIWLFDEWIPWNCPQLPSNIACGHPTIWTIPILTQAFVECITWAPHHRDELLRLLRKTRMVCRDLSAEDHYNFDQIESGRIHYQAKEVQHKLGEEMKDIFMRLANILESSI